MQADSFVEAVAEKLDRHEGMVGLTVGRTAYGIQANKEQTSVVVARVRSVTDGTHVTLTFTSTAETPKEVADTVAAAAEAIGKAGEAGCQTMQEILQEGEAA